MQAPPARILQDFGGVIAWLAYYWSLLLRRNPGLYPTSWWRDPQNNARSGGATLSQHLLGLAMDFGGPSQVQIRALADAKAMGLNALRHDVGSGLHLHIQAWPKGSIPQDVFAAYGMAPPRRYANLTPNPYELDA